MNTCLIFILIVQSLYAISSATNVRPQLCTLPKKTGPCRASKRMYYYDARQAKCLLFTYGGCRGNGNRFKTLQDCEKACKAISSATNVRPQLCTLPKKTGPCRARKRMYYYDASQGKCLLFTYGGCRGNGNRFKTLQDCEKTCKEKKCEKPCFKSYRPVCGSDRKTYSNECVMEVADCKSNEDIKKVHDGRCKPKCPNLCTMEFNPQCGSDGVTYSNPCSLGVAKCKSNGKITLAHKGKCGKKCDKPCSRIYFPVCGSDGKTYPNECVLKVADCKSEEDITKIHDSRCKPKCPTACTMEYNPQCGSDGVTYSNPCSLRIAKCKSNGKITLAHKGKCDVCALKRYPGPCKASFQRYYYNSSSKKCERFIYGGCHGNGNNFATLAECQKSCDVCSLKPDSGICYAYIPRYFYSSTTKGCERFIYGGCRGNKNNFKTIQDCQAKCQ